MLSDNLVDIVSRGIIVDILRENICWWNGLVWLKKKKDEWFLWKFFISENDFDSIIGIEYKKL